jgi:uncharacterized repeat protein (TIGR03803 family)
VIYSFHELEGVPTNGLAIDQKRNLYGTTMNIVFELSPGSDGAWNYTVLHSFPAREINPPADGDGVWLYSGVIVDAQGNLYGTTVLGGTYNDGTVFEIPAGQGANGADKVLHSFDSANGGGESPLAGLVFDHSGNLYGTTYYGGAYDRGTLFKLSPNGDGTWKIIPLHDFGGFNYNGFQGIDGINPLASLIVDADGHLYGTTQNGGYQRNYSQSLGGTAFEAVLY